MSNGETRVRDIVRSAVVSQASHELPYLARLERFDDSWVLWRLRHGRNRDEPLGFGLGEMAQLVTPAVWIALNELAKDMGTAAGDGMLAGIRALFRKLLRRKPRPATVPALTEEQRQKVRDTVYESLVAKGFRRKRAEDIANAVHYALSAGD